MSLTARCGGSGRYRSRGGAIELSAPRLPNNTVVSTRTYNLRGQVVALLVTAPSGTVLDQSFDYAYTAGGAGPVDAGPNLDRVIDNRDATESRFSFYDGLHHTWTATTLAGAPLDR